MNNKALFIYTHSSTFVRGDISILRKKYNLKEYQFKNAPKNKLPLSLIKLFFYLLFNIYKFDLIYIWFADYHSFLPSLFAKLFGKRVYIVIGGYDVCREKKYSYGSFSKPLRAYLTGQSIKWASCNLCVSKNIERTVNAIAPNAKTTVIYNGVLVPEISLPTEAGSYLASAKDLSERKVLCVALVSTVQAFYIKGIDRYNRVASLLPHIQFILIGCKPQIFTMANEKPSSNLTIVDAIPHNQLHNYYSTAHVYCQFSRRESFSLSLAEAMSYRMIPVIATTGGMPEVTGGLGFSLFFYEKSARFIQDATTLDETTLDATTLNSEKEAAQLVKKALETEKSDTYRERVIKNLTLEIRETQLFEKLITQPCKK